MGVCGWWWCVACGCGCVCVGVCVCVSVSVCVWCVCRVKQVPGSTGGKGPPGEPVSITKQNTTGCILK